MKSNVLIISIKRYNILLLFLDDFNEFMIIVNILLRYFDYIIVLISSIIVINTCFCSNSMANAINISKLTHNNDKLDSSFIYKHELNVALIISMPWRIFKPKNTIDWQILLKINRKIDLNDALLFALLLLFESWFNKYF